MAGLSLSKRKTKRQTRLVPHLPFSFLFFAYPYCIKTSNNESIATSATSEVVFKWR